MPTAITRGAASALAFGWARITAILDPYFKYVTMLLPGNGTNGAQNNTFLDSSTNNFTITRNGNTTQGTFTPYGSNWSNYTNNAAYNSGGNYLSVATNAAFGFGTGDFTAEAWVYTNDTNNQDQCVIDFRDGTNTLYFYIRSTATQMLISTNVGTTSLSSSGSAAQWVHVAIARQGTSFRCFINGSLIQTFTDSTNYQATAPVRIGQRYTTGPDALVGYISNLRIVKGTAVYTAAFTPSTTPLTAISGTSLLTCQSNRFIDNSTNSFAITVTGTPSVQRFSPFSPSAAYSTTTIGGSGYFDGNGDYLTNTSNSALAFGTGAFTFECWVYYSSAPSQQAICGGTGNVPEFEVDTGKIRYFGSTDVYGTTSITGGQWYHFAWARSGTGANQAAAWVNGVREVLTTDTTNYAPTSFGVGGRVAGSTYTNGFICDARVVKGTAVYSPSSSTITVPTSPLTAVANTSLLLNFTNAGIIDNAMMAVGETIADAQISTAQSKFGGSSIKFDGTGDYLNFPASVNWIMKGDFTVELWFYMAAGVNSCLIDQYFASTGGAGNWQIYVTSGGTLQFYYDGSSAINHQTTVPLNQWNHIAATRSGSTVRVFLNGVVGTTTATSTAVVGQNNTLWVGAQHSAGPSLYPNGYMDDVRITNGYARYTANFTPPTAAFPTQ